MAIFQTTLFQPEGRPVTGIVIPAEIIEALSGGKKPAVVLKVNDYIYRTTVGFMGGKFMAPFSSEHRAASGIKGGDSITVDITLDTAPRVIDVPEDLAEALDKAGKRGAFDKLAPSHRKEHVRAIEDAKTAETRTRRIEKALSLLS